MAPLKPQTEARYEQAVKIVRNLLTGELEGFHTMLESISEMKGLINRCVRQDQWDWFTVYSRFGDPDPRRLTTIGPMLGQMRVAIKESNLHQVEILRRKLIDADLLTYCYHFLGEIGESTNTQDGSGYIYILSKRNQPSILKIGMTTRSVTIRVKEINSATGILEPLSARRVFKVRDASTAEKEIFSILEPHRIRFDREFFDIDYYEAVRLIEDYLEQEALLQRSTGTLKWFSSEKRYGFIVADDGQDIFVHISEVLPQDIDEFQVGGRVEFDIGYRPEGVCAKNVVLLNSGAEGPDSDTNP